MPKPSPIASPVPPAIAAPDSAPLVAAESCGDHLLLRWADGLEGRFHAAWLRDNSPAPDCRDPGNGQRFFEIALLEGEPAVKGARLAEEGAAVELVLAPDGHQTRYAAGWLRPYAEPPAVPRRELWGGGAALPVADWPALRDDRARRLDWLRDLAARGVARVTGLPTEPGSGAAVIALFGYLRETNYGRLFDVVSRPDPINLAYTGLALGVHSDNPYREPVPGLQLLHCLSSDAEGGDSIVRDGFQAAERLRREDPEAFALLAGHEVPFRFADRTAVLESRGRLIETDDGGRVTAVRWNNRSAAPFDLPFEVMGPYYRAYRAFGRLLHDPAEQVAFRMAAGEAFLLDNRRVLHGRTAFSGAGQRHLQGCYADRDGLWSTIRVLERELQS